MLHAQPILDVEADEVSQYELLIQMRGRVRLRPGRLRVGFASFYYPKHLPIHVLMIDGAFVKDLPAAQGRSIRVARFEC